MNDKSKFVVSWRQRKKLELIQDKGGKCQQCGYDNDVPGAFVFHHRDPKQKDFSISGKSWSFERLKKETDKCDLLCVRCHAEKHDKLYKTTRDEALKRHQNRTIRKYKTRQCKYCHEDFSTRIQGQKYCSQKCSRMSRRQCEHPSKRQLAKMLTKKSWCAIGRKYGVSDNAIRKWARKYELIV